MGFPRRRVAPITPYLANEHPAGWMSWCKLREFAEPVGWRLGNPAGPRPVGDRRVNRARIALLHECRNHCRSRIPSAIYAAAIYAAAIYVRAITRPNCRSRIPSAIYAAAIYAAAIYVRAITRPNCRSQIPSAIYARAIYAAAICLRVITRPGCRSRIPSAIYARAIYAAAIYAAAIYAAAVYRAVGGAAVSRETFTPLIPNNGTTHASGTEITFFNALLDSSSRLCHNIHGRDPHPVTAI